MTPPWRRGGWLAGWLPRRRPRNAAAELLAQHADVVRHSVEVFARLNELNAAETRELEVAVDARLAADDFEAIRAFRGQSRFATYLRVVVGQLVLEHREELWRAWRRQAEVRGLTAAATALEVLVYEWATSPDEALAAVAMASDPKPDRAALEALWAAKPWRGARHVIDPRWQRPPGGTAPPGARVTTQLEQELARALHELPGEGRLLLQTHFALQLPIEALAALHRRPPEQLARRINALLEQLRARLAGAGFQVVEIRTLLRNPRPSWRLEGEKGRSRSSNQPEMPDEPSNGD